MSEPTNEDIVAEAINQITARYWSGANHFAMHAWIVVGEVERLQARVAELETEYAERGETMVKLAEELLEHKFGVMP